MRCLRSGKYNMRADILKQGEYVPPVDGEESGHWETRQDPDTGEIVRVWVPDPEQPSDDPATPELESGVDCLVRGHMTLGAPTSDVSEGYSGKEYMVGEFAKMWLSPDVKISRRDQVTNIRDKNGTIIYKEEEFIDSKPTVFSVVGITPIVDQLIGHVENFVMLERAPVQEA